VVCVQHMMWVYRWGEGEGGLFKRRRHPSIGLRILLSITEAAGWDAGAELGPVGLGGWVPGVQR
jgi:hypothetical protein